MKRLTFLSFIRKILGLVIESHAFFFPKKIDIVIEEHVSPTCTHLQLLWNSFSHYLGKFFSPFLLCPRDLQRIERIHKDFVGSKETVECAVAEIMQLAFIISRIIDS